jgi:hypothetical protein
LGSGVILDGAHQPALSYVPFLLTGDSYYLENLQRQVMFILSENPSTIVRLWCASTESVRVVIVRWDWPS